MIDITNIIKLGVFCMIPFQQMRLYLNLANLLWARNHNMATRELLCVALFFLVFQGEKISIS